jgi:RNA polymerase sigma factor (sigma-70 family)
MIQRSSTESEFATLFNELLPPVRRFVRRRVADRTACEEIENSVMLQLWRRSALDVDTSFVGAASVALGLISNERRSRSRRARLHDAVSNEAWLRSSTAGLDGIAAMHDPSDARDRLERVLAQLGEDDRDLLIAARWDGLTSRELAALYGLTEAAIRKRLSRIEYRLRTDEVDRHAS